MNFRGVSAQQDGRFKDKTKALKEALKFPECLNVKVRRELQSVGGDPIMQQSRYSSPTTQNHITGGLE